MYGNCLLPGLSKAYVYLLQVRYWCTGAEYGIGESEPSIVLVYRSRVRYWRTEAECGIGIVEPSTVLVYRNRVRYSGELTRWYGNYAPDR
jgi:hypothetical protein